MGNDQPNLFCCHLPHGHSYDCGADSQRNGTPEDIRMDSHGVVDRRRLVEYVVWLAGVSAVRHSNQ